MHEDGDRRVLDQRAVELLAPLERDGALRHHLREPSAVSLDLGQQMPLPRDLDVKRGLADDGPVVRVDR